VAIAKTTQRLPQTFVPVCGGWPRDSPASSLPARGTRRSSPGTCRSPLRHPSARDSREGRRSSRCWHSRVACRGPACPEAHGGSSGIPGSCNAVCGEPDRSALRPRGCRADTGCRCSPGGRHRWGRTTVRHSGRKTRRFFHRTPFEMSRTSGTMTMVFVLGAPVILSACTDGDVKGGAFPFLEYGQYIRHSPVRQSRQHPALFARH